MTPEQFEELKKMLAGSKTPDGADNDKLDKVLQALEALKPKADADDEMKEELTEAKADAEKEKERADSAVADLEKLQTAHDAELEGNSEGFLARVAEFSKLQAIGKQIKADSAEIDGCKTLSTLRTYIAGKLDSELKADSDVAYQSGIIRAYDLNASNRASDDRYRGDSSEKPKTKTYRSPGLDHGIFTVRS